MTTENKKPGKTENQHILSRSMPVKPASIDEKNRTIEFTLATDAAVSIYHWDYGQIREVLSMESPQIPEQVPMLDTHKYYSTTDQIGAFRDGKVENNPGGISNLVMTAYFGESQKAYDTYKLYASGLGTDCSVRYEYLAEAEYVPDGKKIKVNGRTEAGPLLVVHKWRVIEGSLCPIGADQNCKARSANIETPETTTNLTSNTGSKTEPEPILETSLKRSIKTMDNENTTNQAPVAPDTKAIEAARAEGARLEAERRSGIESVCALANYPADKARELANDVTMTQARAIEAVRAWQTENNKPVPQARASEIEVGTNRSLEHVRKAAAQGMALGWDANVKIEKPVDGSEAYRSGGKERVMRELLRAHNVDSSLMSGKEVIDAVCARAYVLADFANITADAANIKFAADVGAADTVYQYVAEIGKAEDFKKQYRARLMDAGSLPAVNENGEYEILKLTDEGSHIQLVEHGASIPLTRRVLLDGSLDMRVAAVSRAITRTQLDIEAALFGLLINNKMFDGTQIFTSAHKNIGTAAALSTTSLDEARQLMAAIKGANGQPLGLKGKIILTGAKYARQAAEIVTSTSAPAAAHAGVNNYYRGLQAFETSAITDGAWYLLGNPAVEPHLEVVFLNGQRNPQARVSEKPGQSGIVLDVNLDYGVACHSWRNAIKNAGV